MALKQLTVFVENKQGAIVDITDALAGGFEDLGRDIYISFRNDSLPKVCDGGTMELYESRREFKTYKVTVNSNIIRFGL